MAVSSDDLVIFPVRRDDSILLLESVPTTSADLLASACSLHGSPVSTLLDTLSRVSAKKIPSILKGSYSPFPFVVASIEDTKDQTHPSRPKRYNFAQISALSSKLTENIHFLQNDFSILKL